MTVQTETSRSGPYAGAGTTGPFTVGFRFIANAHLRVIRTTTAGIDSTLTLNTDYTVSGAGGSTGTVTLTSALALGEKLTIVRDVPFTQNADYVPGDAFPAESHEDALDLLTMQTQQLAEVADRTLTLPATVSGVSAELPAPSGLKVFGWNAAGTAIENLDANTLASIIAYGTAASDLFDGDGVTTAFSLSGNPASINNLDVSIGGVAQRPGLDYLWTSGTIVTFTTAPAVGTDNILVRYMQALAMGSGVSSDIQYAPAGVGAVVTTVQAKLRESVSLDDFSGADDGAKLISALAVSQIVHIPAGARTSSVSVAIGANKCVIAEQPGSTSWTVTTDNPAFILNGAYSELHGLYVTKSGAHTKNLIEVGTTLIKADRAVLSGIRAVGAGQDGIQVINGNLGTLRDIQSISNGRDGINFTTDTADNNAWTIEGHVDLGSNARDGLNLAGVTSVSHANNSRSHVGTYIACQSNGRYGAYIGSRSNILALYLENNVTKDLYFDTYAWGNQVMLTQVSSFASITEVTAGVNEIRTNSMNADYVGGFWNKVALSGRAGKGLIVYSDDGTAGTLSLEKTGVRAFKLAGGGSNADFVTSFTNDNASFAHSIVIQGVIAPLADNTRSCGTSTLRWGNSYSTNFRPGNGSPTWTSGSGTPEGVLSASVGSLYTRIDGGASTTLYVKESGAGSTGWVAK